MKEKVAAIISAAMLSLAIIGVHVNTQVELARVTERVDGLNQTNVRTLEVLEKLAISVDKLSESVARLDERTKVLERGDRDSENRRERN